METLFNSKELQDSFNVVVSQLLSLKRIYKTQPQVGEPRRTGTPT